MTATPIEKRIGELADDAFITVPEAARVRAISNATAWRWVKAGVLPVVRIGNTTRVRVGELRRLAA